MRTTIDAAGRIVIPRAIRERVGLIGPSEVDVEVEGASIRVEPVTAEGLVEKDGLLVIPATGEVITVEMVRRMRELDQR